MLILLLAHSPLSGTAAPIADNSATLLSNLEAGLQSADQARRRAEDRFSELLRLTRDRSIRTLDDPQTDRALRDAAIALQDAGSMLNLTFSQGTFFKEVARNMSLVTENEANSITQYQNKLRGWGLTFQSLGSAAGIALAFANDKKSTDVALAVTALASVLSGTGQSKKVDRGLNRLVDMTQRVAIHAFLFRQVNSLGTTMESIRDQAGELQKAANEIPTGPSDPTPDRARVLKLGQDLITLLRAADGFYTVQMSGLSKNLDEERQRPDYTPDVKDRLGALKTGADKCVEAWKNSSSTTRRWEEVITRLPGILSGP